MRGQVLTHDLKLTLDEVQVPCKAAFLRVLARLALSAINPSSRLEYVGLEEIARVQDIYEYTSLNSLKANLSRDMRDLRARFPEIVESPRGAAQKAFRLNPALEWSVDRTPEELWTWLGLGQLPREREPAQVRQSYLCSLVEALLEGGGLDRVETLLEQLEDSPSSPGHTLEYALLRSQLYERQGDLARAWDWYSRAFSLLPEVSEPRAKQTVALQHIRLLCVEGNLEQAEKRILRFRSELGQSGSPYLLGRLALLSGLVTLELNAPGSEPKDALPSFQDALERFRQEHLWWGVQAAYANLGLTCYHQAKRYGGFSNRGLYLEWCAQGAVWLEHSFEFCTRTGFGYATPEHLLFLCKMQRALGERHRAQVLATTALEQARMQGLVRLEAEALLELGLLCLEGDEQNKKRLTQGFWKCLYALNLSSNAWMELEREAEDALGPGVWATELACLAEEFPEFAARGLRSELLPELLPELLEVSL